MTIYAKLSATFLLLSISLAQACRQRSPEEVEQIIAKSETLSYIDQICKEFPRPKQFELEKKDFYGNSEMNAVNYKYIAHMPFADVKSFYQDEGLREKYTLRVENYSERFINEIWFKRDDVSINIENRPPSWIVNIGCSKGR